MSYPVKVFSTRGSDVLAKAVCEALKTRLPKDLWSEGCLKPGKIKVVRFSNENLQVQVENVRDHFVVVIHSQVPPVNERLVELFCLLDALKGARPVDILVVFPCYPYARSDKKNQPRISTMAYRFAHILNYSFGIERVMLLDPHDDHIKHYFDPVADEITSIYLLFDYLERNVFTFQPKEESVLVFLDEGASKRYSGFARLLRIPTAYIDKGRSDDREQPEVKGIIGNVEDKFCLMIDDEILTGKTAIEDAKAVLEKGGRSVWMLAPHAPFADKNMAKDKLIQKLEYSSIEKFVVTNSIPSTAQMISDRSKFVVLPVEFLLAEAIKRTALGESITELYNPKNVFLYRG